MLAIWIPQLLISTRTVWTWPVRAFAALAVFPVMEGLAAMVLGWADGYWSH